MFFYLLICLFKKRDSANLIAVTIEAPKDRRLLELFFSKYGATVRWVGIGTTNGEWYLIARITKRHRFGTYTFLGLVGEEIFQTLH